MIFIILISLFNFILEDPWTELASKPSFQRSFNKIPWVGLPHTRFLLSGHILSSLGFLTIRKFHRCTLDLKDRYPQGEVPMS
jgi:hypothetical protein